MNNLNNHSHSSLNDAITQEMFLLEEVNLLGRLSELRHLAKLLKFAKSGQAKAVLISGDTGIGKTALTNTFIEVVRKGFYSRVLTLSPQALSSTEGLYVDVIQQLQAEAGRILDEALAAANQILEEMDLTWTRQDLTRAIALVKLQESIGGKDPNNQEQLVKAIRSSVPKIKQLKSSVQDNIEKLVNLLMDPWLVVATSLLNPLVSSLQAAIQLAEDLRSTHLTITDGTKALVENSLLEAFPPINLPSFAGASDASIAGSGVTTLHVSGSQGTVEVGTKGQSVALNIPQLGAKPKNWSQLLSHHLSEVFDFINKAIRPLDSAMVIVMDQWERIADIQDETAREELKELMSHLVRHTTEEKDSHVLMVLCCQSTGESSTLGGSLYSLFRSKLLLSGLDSVHRQKLIRNEFKASNLNVDDAVLREVFHLTQGNPFWILKIQHYLRERAESNEIKTLDLSFFQKLAIEKQEDILELAFIRVKLEFLNNEQTLFKVIAALLKQFGEHAFSVPDAMKELHAAQGLAEMDTYEALRQLFKQNFLVVTTDSDNADPYYQIQSRVVYQFLLRKTANIQTDVSSDEKLRYLKKIIPLSVKSGELSREKTMEVLALGQVLGNQDIVSFLENNFIESLIDERPVVRVNALNNLALIESERSFETVLRCLKDPAELVREYAAQNLALLSGKLSDPSAHEKIVAALMECIDDECEAVRVQVYTTLSKYRYNQELEKIFLKGMSDSAGQVRIIAAESLVAIGSQSPLIRESFKDALQDSVLQVRQLACQGIQRFPEADSIDVLIKVLREEPETSIKGMAADALCSMDNSRALAELTDVLVGDYAENLQIVIARAFGKRPSRAVEDILNQALQNPGKKSIATLWVCAQSLGNIGCTETSLLSLNQVKKRYAEQEIMVNAAELAIDKIQNRINTFRQHDKERQSNFREPSTPLIAPLEEVIVVEDEVLEIDL